MIHERDFIAGRTIRANIMDGMEKSRRVIFILSRYMHNFLDFVTNNLFCSRGVGMGVGRCNSPNERPIQVDLPHLINANVILMNNNTFVNDCQKVSRQLRIKVHFGFRTF